MFTVVFGRKGGRRRTDVAATDPDVLKNAKRLDAHDELLTTMHRDVVGLSAALEAQDKDYQARFKRIEDRLWPTN